MNYIRKKLILAMLVAVAIILHIVESFLPTTLLFPGAKLGLANIVTLWVLINYGFISSLQVLLFRIIISSLLIGTFLTTSFFLSLTGGLISLIIMSCFYYKSSKFSLVGISILGASCHNLGQIIMAYFLISNWRIFFYLPYLLLLSLPTGLFIGLIVIKMERYLKFDIKNKQEF